MPRIIALSSNTVNTVRHLDNQQSKNSFPFPKKSKELKLHSSDIAYLEVLHWFQSKGNITYLSPSQWPVYLERFGGKASKYKTQKTRWAKMKALGYVKMEYQSGNRNIHMTHQITETGVEALNHWFEVIHRPKKFTYKKQKNGPSNLPKKVRKSKKTAPPLNSELRSNERHRDYIANKTISIPINKLLLKQLTNFGIYDGLAKRLFKEHSEQGIIDVINLTKKRKVDCQGAYIVKVLNKRLKIKQKDLELISHSEKAEEIRLATGKLNALGHMELLRKIVGQ